MNVGTKETHYSSGTIEQRRCYLGSKLHREDGPALEWLRKDGTLWHRSWHCHGEIHREGGPAAEWFRGDGTIVQRTWCRHGKYHRVDGPAEEWFCENGRLKTAMYYLDGEQVSKKEHSRRVALQKLSARVAGDLEVSL